MTIDVENSISPMVYVLPSLKNDYFPDEIIISIENLDGFIEFDEAGRTLAIHFEMVEEQVEELEYSVKVTNQTSMTSMNYPLTIIFERKEVIAEQVL